MTYLEMVECYIALSWYVGSRVRDFYFVTTEFRTVGPGEFGKGARVGISYAKCFSDYPAARAYFDQYETYASTPNIEDQQQINYLHAIPATTRYFAGRKMRNGFNHHEAKQLAETPSTTLRDLKKHWDEDRRLTRENAKGIAEILAASQRIS